jgi:NodT family efflux transporter outer membrane factor (OMF) lipoprotein
MVTAASSAMNAAERSAPRRRPLLAVLLAAALAGCSFAPRMQTPAIPVADSYKELDEWTTAVPADQLPRDAWWRLYGDRQLDELQQRLIAGSPDLAAALARYQQSQAIAAQLSAGLFPNVNANASVTHSRDALMTPLFHLTAPIDYDTNIVGLQAAYELDLWGRVRNTVAAGKAQAAASAADLESARLSLQAQLADDYIVLRELDQEITLLNDTVTAYGQALDLTRQRFDSGITSGLDVARAQNQLDETRSQLAQLQAQRALTEHAIAALVGEEASRFALPPRQVELSLPHVPPGLPSALLQRRPDVAAAERRMRAANAGIGVARAAYFPDVSLSAAIGFESDQRAGWIQAPNTYWSLGPGALLTVFDAGRHRAQVAQARAQFEEAAADYRSVALAAFEQIEDNLALIGRYHAADEAERSAVAAAQQALDYSLTRYRAGAVNYLEVVISQTAALQSRIEALDISTRQLRASVQLIRALGGGWQDPASTVATNTPPP